MSEQHCGNLSQWHEPHLCPTCRYMQDSVAERDALRAEVERLRGAIRNLPTWANRNFDLVAEDYRKVTDWAAEALAGKEAEG